jgi:CheY-like chemotaxis protein
MKSILIIEDDRKIALALGVRLRANGYQTLLANEALEGVTMAVEKQPHLIISDILMPLGGGFSVLERLLNLPTTATIPVIFITASKQPGLKEKAAQLGAVGFLEKPFEAEELLGLVKKVLGESSKESENKPDNELIGEESPSSEQTTPAQDRIPPWELEKRKDINSNPQG